MSGDDELDPANYRPCVLLVIGQQRTGREAERLFRRQGWDVYQARDAAEARRLARMLEPELVVLDAGGMDWEAWTEWRGSKVVLLTDDEGIGAHLKLNAVVVSQNGLGALARRMERREAA